MGRIYQNRQLTDLIIDGEREKWSKICTIEGLENVKEYYFISNFGRVKSIKSKRTMILLQNDNGKGYLKVQLFTLEGNKISLYIHRLVALAFVKGNDETVNHNDYVRKNNHYKNLSWQSLADNSSDGTSKRLLVFDNVTLEMTEYSSIKNASEVLDLDYHKFCHHIRKYGVFEKRFFVEVISKNENIRDVLDRLYDKLKNRKEEN